MPQDRDRWKGWLAGCFLVALTLLMAAPLAGAAPVRVQPGDVIRVDVASRSDLSGEFLVGPDGMVTLPSAGSLRASGRTEAELSADLSRRYSLIDREIPRVVVTISRSAGRRVLVLGAVLLPGAYDTPDSATPWDAISLAGGAQEDALLSAVEIIPGTPERAHQTVDVQSAIQSGKLGDLPRLRAGDTVRVPRKAASASGSGMVYIFGAVSQQGPKPLAVAPDLVSALVLCMPSGDAKLERIDIVRKSGVAVEHIRVDARRYLTSAYEPGNVPLREGDTIYVTRSERSAILGAIGVISPVLALFSTILALSR